MHRTLRTLLLLIGITGLVGCGTMNAARPLDPGQHVVGVTFGGPFTTSLGPPIPVPNLIVEGRTGLEPIGSMPVDVNYGVNGLAAAFGLIGNFLCNHIRCFSFWFEGFHCRRRFCRS